MSPPCSPFSEQVWKGGRQGKGREAGQLQERDEASNLLAHHTQDHQAKKLIDACLGLPPVEPESRAAIGARRKQAPLPAGSEDARREPCGDGRSSLEPDGNRWHREPGVLSQERHESRNVRLLPQGHIAVKEVLSLGARFRNRALASDVALVQRASGT